MSLPFLCSLPLQCIALAFPDHCADDLAEAQAVEGVRCKFVATDGTVQGIVEFTDGCLVQNASPDLIAHIVEL